MLSVEEALDDLPNIIDGNFEYKYKPKNEYQKMIRNNNKIITEHIMPPNE